MDRTRASTGRHDRRRSLPLGEIRSSAAVIQIVPDDSGDESAGLAPEELGSDGGGDAAPAPSNTQPPGRAPQDATTSAPGRSVPAININVGGSLIGGTPAQIADDLARLVKPVLDRIALRSR